MAHRISRIAFLGLFFSAGWLHAQFPQIPQIPGLGGKSTNAAGLDDAKIGSGLALRTAYKSPPAPSIRTEATPLVVASRNQKCTGGAGHARCGARWVGRPASRRCKCG